MLGLGLKTSKRTAFEMKGYFLDASTYWSHDLGASSTSLDSLTNLTVIINFSYAAVSALGSGFNIPTILYAIADQANDTGFEIDFPFLSKRNPTALMGQTSSSITMADGSGPGQDLNADGNRVARWGYTKNAPSDVSEGCPYFACAVRFKAGDTNEMQIIDISNTMIRYTEGNNDVANLGDISDETNIQIGNQNGMGGYNSASFTQGTALIHKIAVWNSALTDTEIMKLTGFNHTSLSGLIERADLDGYYHDAVRFKNYSDLGIDSPEHLWDFSKQTPGTYSSDTVSDTGNVGGLNMTPNGNPVVGSRGQS